METHKRILFNRSWSRLLIIAAVLAVAAISLFAGCSRPQPIKKVAATQSAKVMYQCPMHPQIIRDHPGTCPICGMELVPMKPKPKEEKESIPGTKGVKGTEMPSAVPGHAEVSLAAEKIQMIGVRTGKVTMQTIQKDIRTVGLVRSAETAVKSVNAKIEGWVEQLLVDYEGQSVRKGQPLLTIYSPDLVSTQQEYLLALRSRKQLSDSPFPEIAQGSRDLVEATRQRLLLWDIPARDIAKIEKTGKPIKALTLYAPAGGVVTKKLVFAGAKVMPGAPLYELSDLSRIWLEADIYETDIPDVKVGQSAIITLDSFPARQWPGKVVFINPVLETQTRTVKARLELSNPGMLLKPGMYGNVSLKIPKGRGLIVPFDAVMDSGERKFVFIALGEGRFEPRAVELGDKVNNNFYIVTRGLQEGEEVVTSGNFLIDSESRLQATAQGTMAGMPGMESTSKKESKPGGAASSMPNMPGM